MVLSGRYRAFTASLVNVCRLLLATVLVISGFVKAVDPLGLSYKLREYAAAFGADMIPDDILLCVSMMLCAAEFIMGVMLLTGVYRRVVTLLTFLFFLFFTPFTLVLALWNPVRDCGCFGDAFQLSNWATFGKNMLLFIMSTLVWIKRRMFVRRISVSNRWMIALFAVFYIVLVEWVSLSYLPVMDFRPFSVGRNLREVVEDVPSVERTLYKFEKNGEVRDFDDETYPDSTWNYLGSRVEIISKGHPALVSDFSFIDLVSGEDWAEAIMNDTSYVSLLILNRVEDANEERIDKINELYDLSREYGFAFYAASSSDEDAVEDWKKRTDAEYDILWADDVMLKTMIRSNPGVLLIKNGTIVGKWNVADIPDFDYLMRDPFKAPERLHGIYKYTRDARLWFFLFAVPLLLISVIDFTCCRAKKRREALEKNCDTTK